ncbi:MAG: 4-hydroxythreonine-4-phosphate dehydrogenase PdxA [bacterium]
MPPITLALTIGDLNGIGPEVALKAIHKHVSPRNVQFLLIGPAAAWRFWAERLQIPIQSCPVFSDGDFSVPISEKIVILETDFFLSLTEKKITSIPPVGGMMGKSLFAVDVGKPTMESGLVSARCVELAAGLALEKKVDAIVTAPLSKVALRLVGVGFPGHTEMLAHLANIKTPVMLMVAGDFRVAVATTHLALKEVPKALTIDSLVGTAQVLFDELQERFKIAAPRIAVAGLNPHAGESGTLGKEEQKIIAPAIEILQKQGYRVDGPFPADALFSRIAATEKYDAYLAMYHDQGLIAAKMRSGGKGVNYTCGLPFIRTSPDHGTAFDIAGKNVADATSMMEAIQLAVEIARKNRAGKHL